MEVAIENFDADALDAAFRIQSTESDAEKRLLVDQLCRTRLIHLIQNQSEEVQLLMLVEMTFSVANKEQCSKTLPCTLLGDIFDTTTVDRCERIFRFVEDKLPIWKSQQYFDSCRTQLLRMCNDLLRRLSRSVNTVFCGRILVFLAHCLPLTEKSGLNITSQFNVDNSTRYDSSASDGPCLPGEQSSGIAGTNEKQRVPSIDEEMEEGEMNDAAGGSTSLVPIDFNLYVRFWQLQDYFSLPLKCYDRVGWKLFQHNTNEVLQAMTSYKLEEDSLPSEESSENCFMDHDGAESSISVPSVVKSALMSPKERRVSGHGATPDWGTEKAEDQLRAHQDVHGKGGQGGSSNAAYFAKYLTSQKLLQLQLNDSNFRRYVLIQFLILFQYLTTEVKFREKKQHQLSEEQLTWVADIEKKVYDLLAETYPEGKKFVQTVKHILKREEYWSQWKNAGCEDFTQRADKDKMPLFKRRPKSKYDPETIDLANAELNRLWNLCPDNFEACRDPARQFVPTLEEYFDEAIEQMIPDAQIEEEYKVLNDENFQWRALRLLSRQSGHFYQGVKDQALNVRSYLEQLLQQTAKDIPKWEAKFGGDKSKKSVADGVGAEAVASPAPAMLSMDVVQPLTVSSGGETPSQVDLDVKNMNADDDDGGGVPGGGSEDDGEAEDDDDGSELVSTDQLKAVAEYVGAQWPVLNAHFLASVEGYPANLIVDKDDPELACYAVLQAWQRAIGPTKSTCMELKLALLEANVFSEDVATVLMPIDLVEVDRVDMSAETDDEAGPVEPEPPTPVLDEPPRKFSKLSTVEGERT